MTAKDCFAYARNGDYSSSPKPYEELAPAAPAKPDPTENSVGASVVFSIELLEPNGETGVKVGFLAAAAFFLGAERFFAVFFLPVFFLAAFFAAFFLPVFFFAGFFLAAFFLAAFFAFFFLAIGAS